MLNKIPIGLLMSKNGIGLKPAHVRDEQNPHSHEMYKIVPVFSYLLFWRKGP
jgi:hypothetical protein